jgi:leader peptidase (prepilin peptidase) / N-methyltransferase
MNAQLLLVAYSVGMTAVFGLLIGSFLNVVVWRVPAGLSVVRPRSACPQCGHVIRSRDNVPVLSWLVLRGRCRDCATPISARDPIVELVTALAFVAVFVRFSPMAAGTGSDEPERVLLLLLMLFVMSVSVALTLIDVDTQRLPDAIVLPSYIVVIVCGAALAFLGDDWGAFLRAAVGMIGLGGAYLALAIAVPRGMGLGDVKLAGVLGFVLAYLGWGPLAVGAFGAFVLGGTFSIVLMVLRRVDRKSGIPFGPWMLGGAWCGIFFGDALFRAYLSLLGL